MLKKLLILFTVIVLTLTALYQLSTARKTQSYTAHYQEPCGRSLLVLESVDGKSIAVQAIGNSPIYQLRHIVLVNTKLNVSGYFTGKHIDDHHCGNYPEFYVTDFSSAGSVTRCSSVADWVMYERVVLYPPNLPENELINIDFNKHSGLLTEVPSSQCRTVNKETICNPGEAPASVCGEDVQLCCKKPSRK